MLKRFCDKCHREVKQIYYTMLIKKIYEQFICGPGPLDTQVIAAKTVELCEQCGEEIMRSWEEQTQGGQDGTLQTNRSVVV